MRRGAVALRGNQHLVGVLPQIGDQLRDGGGLDPRRIDDQRIRHMRHHDDGFELRGIEAEFWIEVVIDDQRRRRRRKQSVAIRRRVVDRLGADIAGRARPVVDDDRLPPFARQPLRDDARHRIRRSAGQVSILGARHDRRYQCVAAVSNS